MNNSISGYTKSACLLFFLGVKKSKKILRHFTEDEKKKIIYKLSDSSIFSNRNIDVAVKCYKEHCKKLIFNKKKYFNNYFESVINKSFNKKDRLFLIDSIKNKKIFFKNVEKTNLSNAKNCYFIFRKEHPQIIAVFLKYLDKKKSFKVLSLFKKKYRYEIIRRMFEIKKISVSSKNEFFKIVNYLFKKKDLLKKYNLCKSMKIFNLFSKKEKINILRNCFKENFHIRKKIICEMFTFKDIFKMKNDNINILLKYINKKILYKSITNLKEKFRNKILANMSKKQLYYFFKMIKNGNLKFSKENIKNSRKNILDVLKLLLEKNILILKDMEKIYA
ncbi:MAG: flagellar motor switch protein FliG [Buchnera aphidicola (Ceratovacuna japonica)]